MQLIFEIGCEELPASFCQPALDQIAATFTARAAELRLRFDSVRTVATPRRLTLLVEGLAAQQTDIEEVRTGPPASAAFKDGEPTRAALGFAKGQGVDPADLYTVETEKGAYLAAKVFEKGSPTRDLLPALLLEIIEKLHFPKSMRWAARRERFARPVRWILAVLDGEVVPVEFAGVQSANITYGQRFAAPGAIEISTVAEYFDKLEKAHVLVDPTRRRALISERLTELAAEHGATLVDDPALLEEVTFLVEEPHALAIDFGDAYLELPDEVLISSMRSHQRYFSLANPETGALIATCIVVYNTPVTTTQKVREGNLRVLKARLDDARFFWEKDQKTSLDARLERLDDVVWLAKLGSMKARVERMSALVAKLADVLNFDTNFDDTVKQHAMRAAILAKSDLLTDMVGEFPDLQGLMGREYALASGEDPAVAQAIFEQYLPRGADDAVPASDAGALVALAEKLDALVGCFSIGLIPTSTSDPYALRRAALGVIRILEEREYAVSFSTLARLSIEVYREQRGDTDLGDQKVAAEDIIEKWVDFAATRLKFQLGDQFPTDVVDAVLAVNRDDVLSVLQRVRALSALRQEPDFERLAAGFKRVVNILRKQAEAHADLSATIDQNAFDQPEEGQLYAAYLRARADITTALRAGDWAAACDALIALKAPVDDFFDHVMVMAEDPTLRNNRIALLGALASLFLKVADISKIQAE